MAVTLSDVARALGCNISTVSRALRDDPRVSVATRTRVQAAAATLGYRPNLSARNLATGRTRTVWMLMGHLGFSTDYEPAQAASRHCQQHGYDVHIVLHHGDGDTHARLMRRLRQHCCDGVLIIPHDLDAAAPQLRELIADAFPIVFIDRHLPALPAPAFSTDNHGAADELSRRCAAAGAIGVVDCFYTSNTVEQARAAGLAQGPLPRLSAAQVAALNPDQPIALIGSGGWAIHQELHAHPQVYTGRPLIIAVFDHWEGEPYPAREVIVCRQDFARMAELAADRLLALITGATVIQADLTTVSPKGFRSILPQL